MNNLPDQKEDFDFDSLKKKKPKQEIKQPSINLDRLLKSRTRLKKALEYINSLPEDRKDQLNKIVNMLGLKQPFDVKYDSSREDHEEKHKKEDDVKIIKQLSRKKNKKQKYRNKRKSKKIADGNTEEQSTPDTNINKQDVVE